MNKHSSFVYKVVLLVCFVGGIGWWLISNTNIIKTNEKSEIRTSPQDRWVSQFEKLKDPKTGKIPKGIHQQEMKAALKVSNFELPRIGLEKAIPAITITPRGPNNYGGRTRALAFDVRNTNIVLSGGVSTGIFRSTDNGATWTRITPAGMIHNLTCLAQDTRSGQENTWYAGTGEKGGSTDVEGAEYVGFGIWKSTDNGLTWTALSATQMGTYTAYDDAFDYVSRMIVNPNNGDVLAIAGEEIKRSTNGGTSWTTVHGSDNTGQPGDIIYNTSSSTFYAAIHGEATTGPGIWSSTDGITWSIVRTPTQLDANGVKRIVLSNVAATSGILAMYELDVAFNCGSGGTSEVGLQEFDGTSTWTDHTDDISNCAGGSTSPKNISLQEGYNMCVTTKPNDANFAYLGGVEIFRYNLNTNAYEFIGGSQASANAINLHVDNHILLFETDDIMWAGNDGGLRKTDVTGMIKTTAGDDNGYTWTPRVTDYVTYQYYGADINPTNGSSFLAGAAQDNAFTIQPTNTTAKEVGPTVDGTSVAIISGTDFTTYSILASYQEGGFARIDNDVQTDITPDDKEQGFESIIYLDADNTSLLYYPYSKDNSVDANGLLRTRNASGLVDGTISSDPTTDWEDMTGVSGALTGTISAMDASRNESFSGSNYTTTTATRKLYFGTEDSKVYRLNDPAFVAEGTAPVEITPPGASGHVSDIAVNPYDDKEILVTYSNYGVASVWHTSDASVASPSWTNVEGPGGSAVEISSARSAMITQASNVTIYMVGTSSGLYGTDALSGATTSWTRIGTDADIGLAVSVEMRLRTSDNKIALGTHGNGLFLLEFPPAVPVELISFTGKATSEGNELRWSTASEENNRGFDVEKSSDGKHFEKIGFVKGNGTSLEQRDYTFLDTEVKGQIAYYRLKQMDFGGVNDYKFEYSDVVAIESAGSLGSQSIRLYPNPTKGAVTLEMNNLTTNSLNLQVFDRSGSLIKSLQLNPKTSIQKLDQLDLAAGVYFVKVITDDYIETIKLIKL